MGDGASRRWTVVMHVPHEGPGLIAAAAAARGVELDLCGPGDPLPGLDGLGGLVVMGGPMSANDTAGHPRLGEEIELLSAAVAANLPVLGICLGAQLLARALGAAVRRNPVEELGVSPVRLTPAGLADPLLGGVAPIIPAVHWHEDTFDIPEGAVHLASTPTCAHQAFRHGRRAYGLQFHVEVDAGLAESWSHHLGDGGAALRGWEASAERGLPLLGRLFEAIAQPTDAAVIDVVRTAAASELDDAAVLAGAMEALATARPRWGWVGVYLLRGDELHLGPYAGPPTEHVRIPVGSGVCGTAVAEGRNLRIDDVRTLDNYLACSASTRSELVVLISDREGIAGQIDVDCDAVAGFDATDERLLETVAALLAPRCARLAGGT